ncbi:hypothetical protein COCNU_scaffold000397G000010 [Cocos nucifera]|nr:hypothetical protein [Cocos nucifera]
MATLETTMTVPSPTLPDEANTLALPEQEREIEKRKKAITRKVKRNLGHYLYDHSVVANLRKAEASRAIQEAQAEIKKV